MDLGYYNARVRGMRRRLLKSEEYRALIGTKDYDGLTDRLMATVYGAYIEVARAVSVDPADILSRAFTARLDDVLSSLWALTPVDARPAVKLVLSAWEAHDLKAVIRGITRGIKREEMLGGLIPAGEFGKGPLSVLAGQPGLRELAGVLETWGSPYAVPVREGLTAYLKTSSTIDVEIGIDRLAITAAGRKPIASHAVNAAINPNDPFFHEVSVARIDMRNSLTLLNLVGRGYALHPAESLFMEGGSITKKAFVSLSRTEGRAVVLKSLAAEVSDHVLAVALRSADPADLLLLEESFDEIIEHRFMKAGRVDPLGAYLACAYAYSIVREIKNLRLMMRSKRFAIPDDEVARLIMPLH